MGRVDLACGFALYLLSAYKYYKPKAEIDMDLMALQIPFMAFGTIFLFRFIFIAPHLLWKEQKEKFEELEKTKIEESKKTLSLTSDEKQDSCSKFVNRLYNDLIENWTNDFYFGNTALNRPYAHVCFRELEKTQSDLRVDESIRNKIKDYLQYFKCEGHLLYGIGECKIGTVFNNEKELSKNKEKIKKLATELAKNLHYITR